MTDRVDKAFREARTVKPTDVQQIMSRTDQQEAGMRELVNILRSYLYHDKEVSDAWIQQRSIYDALKQLMDSERRAGAEAMREKVEELERIIALPETDFEKLSFREAIRSQLIQDYLSERSAPIEGE